MTVPIATRTSPRRRTRRAVIPERRAASLRRKYLLPGFHQGRENYRQRPPLRGIRSPTGLTHTPSSGQPLPSAIHQCGSGSRADFALRDTMWVAGPTVREKRTTCSVGGFQRGATSEVRTDGREVAIEAGRRALTALAGLTPPTTRRFEKHQAVTLPLPGARTTGQINVNPNR
jgi:hypothetical protein